ncbi:MAG: hypothetical protein GY803_00400 [Chloroflexi bacterium]|nr:hypothetical protein [Chloroflexota bacterium]
MDQLGAIIREPTGKLLVAAGLLLVIVAIVGKFSGKFELGLVARVIGGVLGLVFVSLGIGMAQASENGVEVAEPTAIAPIPTVKLVEATAVPPTLTPVPPMSLPSPTSAVIPRPTSRERIIFDPGSVSDSFVTHLTAGQSKGYVLNVMAGQEMHITIPPRVRILVLDTQGAEMSPQEIDGGHWGVAIPQTGDYTIALYGEGETYVTIYIPPL